MTPEQIYKREAGMLYERLEIAVAERDHYRAMCERLAGALGRIVRLDDQLPPDHPARLSHGEGIAARAALAEYEKGTK